MQPIERKRQRISEERSSSARARLSGKERAKIHRERKKKYYEDLEVDNNKLKIEIKDLKAEVIKQAKIIEDLECKIADANHSKIVKELKPDIKLPQLSTFFNITKEEMKENPADSQGINKPYCESKEDNQKAIELGTFAAETKRIQLMKKSFRGIIDNILPRESQMMLVLFEYVPVSKFIRMKNLSRYKYLDRKSVGIPELDEFIEKYLSNTLIEFIEAFGKRYLKTLQEIRRLTRKLVYIRNKLLQTLASLSELDQEAESCPDAPFTKKDRKNIYAHCQQMGDSSVFSKKLVWHIEQRNEVREYCSDIELSD
ncbi:unnamed protein product [Moneuplotes crassus]|uniref:BZIP domain-containing protein n=1 Tax=Euplotes crassus TaxID=5936 RepID=A0AAD1ULH8_EUPCR|nr:unnamed protein product [Moneuplotes crassus]